MSETTAVPTADPTIESAYAAAVLALRELGKALPPAIAARYEAPPGCLSSTGSPVGVPNPTLDITLDPRRRAVSDEVTGVTFELTRYAQGLAGASARLRTVTARWDGTHEGDA